MEHAIRHEIHVRLEENPAFYQSLRERLEQIIEDRKRQQIDAAKQLELLQALVTEARDEAGAAKTAGLNEFAYAILGVLVAPSAAEDEAVCEARKDLASVIQEAIEPETQNIDWVHKPDGCGRSGALQEPQSS